MADPAALKSELESVSAEVKTAAGAPVADSAPREAALVLAETPESWKTAADILTVALSAAE